MAPQQNGPPFQEPENADVDRRKYARDQRRVRDGFWSKIRETLGKVPFLEDAVTAYVAARDPGTPLGVKAILLGALAYFILPADAIPDVIAGLGYTDDAAVLAAAIQALLPHLKPEHRAEARKLLRKPPGD